MSGGGLEASAELGRVGSLKGGEVSGGDVTQGGSDRYKRALESQRKCS